MSLKVKPTRTNLLKTKDSLKLAKKGHELLQQKREVLMIEFMSQVHALKQVSSDIQEQLNRTVQYVRKGITLLGQSQFDRLVEHRQDDFKIEIFEKSVMGVYIPQIELQEFSEQVNPVTLTQSNFEINSATLSIQKMVPKLLKWAEVYISIKRLAEEIKRNNRRVNALANIFIPQYQETVRKITDILDELEKEEFFRMKKIKSKINQAKE